LPFVGKEIDQKVLSRFTEQQSKARQIQQIVQQHHNISMIVVPHYQQASLLSFYLSDGPAVTCAGLCFASHGSSFDEWPGTALDSPARLGSTMLLIGADRASWTNALSFDHIDNIDGDRGLIGVGFRGIKQ